MTVTKARIYECVTICQKPLSVFVNLSQSCRDDVTEETEAEEEK